MRNVEDHTEWGVLTAILWGMDGGAARSRAFETLTLSDFENPLARAAFEESKRILEEGGALDLITLDSALSRRLGDNKAVELAEWLNATKYDLVNPDGYVLTVKRRALQRKTIEAARRGDEKSFSEIARAMNEYEALRDPTAEVKHIGDLAREYKEVSSEGILCGLKALDQMIGGFERGQLVTVGGRTGMGKSSFLLTAALNIARGGKSVVYWSGEQGEEEMTRRCVSQISLVPYVSLKRNQLSGEQAKAVQASRDWLASLPLYLICKGGMTTGGITEKLEGTPCDVLIVDYLTLLRDQMRMDNEVRRIGFITAALKNIALERSILVMAGHQLNRGPDKREDSRPRLVDLRWSGDVEQDSDIVIFPYRVGYKEHLANQSGPAEFIIGKHRNGPVGSVKGYYNATSMRFTDLEDKDS